MKITKIEFHHNTIYGESVKVGFDNGHIQIDESGIITIAVVVRDGEKFESITVNDRKHKPSMEGGRFYARIVVPKGINA